MTSKHRGCWGLPVAAEQAPDCVSTVAALWEGNVGECWWPGLRSECGTRHPSVSVRACGCSPPPHPTTSTRAHTHAYTHTRTHTLSCVSRPSCTAPGSPERPRSLLPGTLSHPSGADPPRGKWGLCQADPRTRLLLSPAEPSTHMAPSALAPASQAVSAPRLRSRPTAASSPRHPLRALAGDGSS